MSSKCCKDTHLVVKVKDAHQAAYTSFTYQILALPVAGICFWVNHETATTDHSANLITEYGPPPPSVLVFIKNCTFRI